MPLQDFRVNLGAAALSFAAGVALLQLLPGLPPLLPVLATTDALVGIIDYPEALLHIADDPDAMAEQAIALLEAPPRRNRAGRRCVLEHYNWDVNLRRLERFLLSDRGAA